jgi:hypothetical protein
MRLACRAPLDRTGTPKTDALGTAERAGPEFMSRRASWQPGSRTCFARPAGPGGPCGDHRRHAARRLPARPRKAGLDRKRAKTRSPELRVCGPCALLLRIHGHSAPTATTTSDPDPRRDALVASCETVQQRLGETRFRVVTGIVCSHSLRERQLPDRQGRGWGACPCTVKVCPARRPAGGGRRAGRAVSGRA